MKFSSLLARQRDLAMDVLRGCRKVGLKKPKARHAQFREEMPCFMRALACHDHTFSDSMNIGNFRLMKPGDEFMSGSDDIGPMNREGLNGRPKDMGVEVLDDNFDFWEFWHKV